MGRERMLPILDEHRISFAIDFFWDQGSEFHALISMMEYL